MPRPFYFVVAQLQFLLFALCLFSCSLNAHAQADPFKATGDNASGKHPFGSYDGGNFDWVDLSGGGLNLRIDFGSMSARGHESRYSFVYSSKFWSATSSIVSGTTVTDWQVERTNFLNDGAHPYGANGAGWRDTTGRLSAIKSSVSCLVSGQPRTYNLYTGYVYTDESGAKHNFPNWAWRGTPPSNSGDCGGTPTTGLTTGYSSDTDGMRLTTTSSGGLAGLKLASGVSVGFSGGSPTADTGANGIVYTDTNGNQWSPTTAANGQNFVTVNRGTDGRVNSVQVLDASGAWQSFNITYGTVSVTSPRTWTLSVITAISLPNTKSYTFEYGGAWGELTKVNLPTGGYIRYEYTTVNDAAYSGGLFVKIPVRFLTARVVSPDGTAGSEQRTTYSYLPVIGSSLNMTLTTTVTRPDGSYEVHQYDRFYQDPYRENSVEWRSAGGTLLKKQIKEWTSEGVPTSSDSSTSDFFIFDLPLYGAGNARITGVTTILDDGQQSKVTKTYDSFTYTVPDGNNTSVTTTRGNIKKIEETAFGSGAPGAVARVTKFKYLHEQDSTYLTPYIMNRVYAKWVGTPTNTFSLAETLYDTTTPTGQHGNPSVSRAALLQTGAPNPDDPPESSVTSWRTTANLFDSFGNLTQSTDPGSHITTYEYTQCNSGYLSATNYALTGMREEKTWNCGIGAPLSSKDVNLQVTTFEYNDPGHLNRLTKVTRPDSSYVTLAYDDTALMVTATQLINNGAATTLVGQHQFDKLGRLIESRLNGDSCGSIKTDTAYDNVGRISQVSNPFCSTSESTYGQTAYQYDGLDRKTKIIPPDGTASSNNSSTTYAGNCMTVTDEAGKTRKSCSDALGRVIEVDEPTPSITALTASGSITLSGTEQSSTSPAGPGTGTVTISGTEQSHTFNTTVGDCVPHILCYDDGSVSITVNGQTTSAFYGQGSTSTSIATALASALNSSSTYVTATSSGAVVTLTARTGGTSTNYSLSASTVYDHDFSHASFTPTPSGSTLTGGHNSSTVYDAGTVSVSIPGFVASVSYSQTVNNTPQLLANAIAAAFGTSSAPVAGSPVTASVSGTALTLTAKQPGVAGDYVVTGSSATTQGTYFAAPSFAATSTTMTGGRDAAGGLINPASTLYSYDVLNNLLCVVQRGTDTTSFTSCAASSATWRPRSFVYNSLSQLTSSTNPESGTLGYIYDLDGNVQTKTAPAPNQTGTATVTTTYSYDVIHRLTGKTYSNGDPSVAYTYDQTGCLGAASCFNLGRRTGMTDAAGSESWAYDNMGRPIKEQRTTNSISKTTGYTYYQDGSVSTITYPSGRVITYAYDALTRPTSTADVPNSITYATGALYSPAGGLASLQNGASLISSFFYNKRLQPCRVSVKSTGTAPSQCSDSANTGNVLDFTYNFGLGVSDNGNLQQSANNRNTARTTSYTYDELNRLLTAATQATSGTYAWGYQFTYDAWGNLLSGGVSQGSAPQMGTAAADINNRVIGFCYDSAGNLLDQVGCPASNHAYVYDGENRLVTTASVTYTYDGDGGRVKKSNGTLYWYGATGDILDESDASGTITSEYIFFGGRRIARRPASGSVNYYFSDQIGSARVITDAAGTVLDDVDFYPFGGERSYASSSGNHYKFTGKERDTESGLDNFGARYYSSTLGRFMTPDWAERPAAVPYADLGNPQSLNLYAYVNNNPITGIDPEGHFLLTSDQRSMGNENGAPYAAPNPQAEQLLAQNQQNQQQQPTPPPAQNNATGRQSDGSYVADLKSKEIAPIIDPNHTSSKSDVVGPNGECVDLTKKFSGMKKDDVGTYQWKKGPKIDKDTKPGTAIATFNDKGRYPSKHGWNSGIYLGQGDHGSIWILDQWPGHSPETRQLYPDSNAARPENAAAYSVITVEEKK